MVMGSPRWKVRSPVKGLGEMDIWYLDESYADMSLDTRLHINESVSTGCKMTEERARDDQSLPRLLQQYLSLLHNF